MMTHFLKRFFSFAALLLLLVSPCFAAQADKQSADVNQQNMELRERVSVLEQRQADLKENLNNSLEIKQQQLNDRDDTLDRLATILGWSIALFAFIIPTVLYVVGWMSFNKQKEKLETEAQDLQKKLKESGDNNLSEMKAKLEEAKELNSQLVAKLEEGKRKVDDIQVLSIREEKITVYDIKKAQKIANDEERTEFERDWASALVLYLTALKNKDKEDYQKALNSYIKLLDTYPEKITFKDLADIYYKIGWCHRELGDKLLAYDYYNTATILNPKYVSAWNNKGASLGDLKKYDDAIECYERAIALKGNYDAAWNNKGVSLQAKGKGFYSEAEKCYIKALAIDPSHEVAKKNLADLQTKMKEAGIMPTSPSPSQGGE